jgi:phosphoribosylformimino-5-aminoimidazole carboxamide ribotide isomerase
MSNFTIYPAIDIREGKCVRLVQGDYQQETIYHEDPVEVASNWQQQGGRWIHVVDLDGAKAGRPVNHQLIARMVQQVNVPIQVGGGLRTIDDVKLLLSIGVSRVIIGTAAIEDRQFVHQLLQQYGKQVAIGIDARDGYVATRGWLETSQVKATDLACELAQYGATTFIFTDISRDGMMGGPNISSIVELAKLSGQTVIASGGVSQLHDLQALAERTADGVGGAIVGKALYTGAIQLPEAILRIEGK